MLAKNNQEKQVHKFVMISNSHAHASDKNDHHIEKFMKNMRATEASKVPKYLVRFTNGEKIHVYD